LVSADDGPEVLIRDLRKSETKEETDGSSAADPPFVDLPRK
jgi:hypothetical protein